ncbi:hypothetical protein [Streptomyces sp. NPDC005408]|uniref:hypothetical protein n=1 Tax=Streptomyces sp. NPDC005408 TaxID=3155341 RepID=UPI0033AD54E2
MTSRNRRLPQNRAWPLTASDINEVLGDNMSHVSDLRFLTGHSDEGYAIGIEWVAAQSFNYGRGTHPDAVGFRIDVIPVATADRADARAALRTHALPQLDEWINGALTADETWRSGSHRRYWRCVDGRVTHHDEA